MPPTTGLAAAGAVRWLRYESRRADRAAGPLA